MNQHDDKSSRLIFKLIASCIANVIIYAASLLLPAPTWQWRRAWIFIATVASTIIIYRVNPVVLQERVKPVVQKSQPFADKIATLLLIAAFLGQIIFIPLDVFRFHLMSKPSLVISIIGLALYLVGWCIVTLTLMENAFAAPVVKHQAERHHKVIDTGVYSVARHPMYASAIPFVYRDAAVAGIRCRDVTINHSDYPAGIAHPS